MSQPLLRSGSFAAVLAAETRSEVLKAVRLPVFLIPTLAFPGMFYVLFGIVLDSSLSGPGMTMATYLLATYGTFGVVGAALFGMGIGVATERGQGWFTLKRATPMPPLAYFMGKLLMSVVIGLTVAVVLAAIGAAFGGVRMPAVNWVMLLAILGLGTIPFCALGCAIGFTTGPNSAPMIANLIYLPMSLASGLWIPIEVMPGFMQKIALFLPPYHLSRLALGAIDGSASGAALHVLVLLGSAALFLALAVFAYHRDDGRTWG